MSYTTTEDSEAAHLCEIYDDEPNSSYEDFIAERAQGVAHDERHYKLNKKAKVGTRIVCAGPKCNNRFIKKSYQQFYKLFAVCEIRGLRMILENPATQPHYLLHAANFIPYTFIDKDRTLRGDYFVKPTAYWFLNCQPTHGFTLQRNKQAKTIMKCKQGTKAGICSEERSMISHDYARNFICDFILGRPQPQTQLSLFN